MPPWVRHQFPEAVRIVRLLRDTRCADPACAWCRTRHDPRAELTRWFGFPDFRPEPADEAGRPLQRVIVEAAMAGQHVLGILPTGTGKSICYQVPALSRYDKTGALTVVISPWPSPTSSPGNHGPAVDTKYRADRVRGRVAKYTRAATRLTLTLSSQPVIDASSVVHP
jgi:hypothetical protein